jgi:hypothetical protein
VLNVSVGLENGHDIDGRLQVKPLDKAPADSSRSI